MDNARLREAFEQGFDDSAALRRLPCGEYKLRWVQDEWSGFQDCAKHLEPLLQDAQRYQWWCDPSNDIPSSVFYQGKPVIDAFIDGAQKEKQQ